MDAQESKPEGSAGPFIRSARLRTGLSQARVSADFGHGPTWLARIESGQRSLAIRDVPRLAALLRLGPADSALLRGLVDARPEPDQVSALASIGQHLLSLGDQIGDLQRALSRAPSFVPTSLEEFIAGAEEVWIAGASLISVSVTEKDFFNRWLSRGMPAEFICTDPDYQQWPRSDFRGRARGERRQDVSRTIAFFGDLKAKATTNRFALYVCKEFPPASVVILNPRQGHKTSARISLHLLGPSSVINPVVEFRSWVRGEEQYVLAALRHFERIREESRLVIGAEGNLIPRSQLVGSADLIASSPVEEVSARDNWSLACRRFGGGSPAPALVLKQHVWSHLALDVSSNRRRSWFTSLASSREVLRVDPRGWGLSGRNAPTMSLDLMVDDLIDVLDHWNCSAVDIIAFYESCNVAIRLASRRPDLVRRIVLWAAGGSPLQSPTTEDETFSWIPRLSSRSQAARRIAAMDQYAFADIESVRDREIQLEANLVNNSSIDAFVKDFGGWRIDDDLPTVVAACALMFRSSTQGARYYKETAKVWCDALAKAVVQAVAGEQNLPWRGNRSEVDGALRAIEQFLDAP